MKIIDRFVQFLALAFLAAGSVGVCLLTAVERKRSEWRGLWKTSWSPDPALGRYETWAVVLFCAAALLALFLCLRLRRNLQQVSERELARRRQPVQPAPAGALAPQGVPGPAAQGGTP